MRLWYKLLRFLINKHPKTFLVSGEIPYKFLRDKNNGKIDHIVEFNVIAYDREQALEIANDFILKFNLMNKSNFYITKLKEVEKNIKFIGNGKEKSINQIVMENNELSIYLSKSKLFNISKEHVQYKLEEVYNYVFENDNPSKVYYN